jgi:hypothetical protein
LKFSDGIETFIFGRFKQFAAQSRSVRVFSHRFTDGLRRDSKIIAGFVSGVANLNPVRKHSNETA